MQRAFEPDTSRMRVSGVTTLPPVWLLYY